MQQGMSTGALPARLGAANDLRRKGLFPIGPGVRRRNVV